MKFSPCCCQVEGACGNPYGLGRAPILYGGEGWSIEPWSPGHPAVLGQIVVEVEGSLTHGDFSSETPYGIQPGWCCPCNDAVWFLDHQSSSCQWATAYEFDPFGTTGSTELPPGCTEPFPCAGGAFPGTPCTVVNSGFISLYFTVGIDLVEGGVAFGLSLLNYLHQSGSGYVCGAQYSARAVIPGIPEEGEAVDISDWTTMYGVDDAPFGANRSCGWFGHTAEGNYFPATVSIRFKAAP